LIEKIYFLNEKMDRLSEVLNLMDSPEVKNFSPEILAKIIEERHTYISL